MIMDTEHYQREIYRQLADINVYTRLKINPTFRVLNKIKSIVGQAVRHNIIDINTQTYLISEHPVSRIIYVLPKIHKDPKNPPGCPIVSSNASVTMPLAKYLDTVSV